MRVAFATYDRPNDVGGVSSWLRRLLPWLKDEGIEVEAHVLSRDGSMGPNCTAFARCGIPFRIARIEGGIVNAVNGCLQLIQQGHPDIYVPNCILPAYYAAGYARRQGIQTVGILHSDDSFYWGIVDEFVNGNPCFKLSAIVSVSTFLAESIKGPAEKNEVICRQIGCGVPLAGEVTTPPDGVFRLVYAGRLEEEQKRISELTRAFCSIARQNQMVEGWIIGEGSARRNVEHVIRESGLPEHRVKLLGFVDNNDIYSLLAQCHAFVLLSDYEGLPVAMLEAMSAGVVPICLDMRSGIREAIHPGFNGLIVRDRGKGFYAAVDVLQSDVNLWSRLSRNARETIGEKFSDEICLAAWLDLLRMLETKSKGSRIQLPKSIHLPRRNSKFGLHDERPGWVRGSLNAVTMALGRYRRWAFGNPVKVQP